MFIFCQRVSDEKIPRSFMVDVRVFRPGFVKTGDKLPLNLNNGFSLQAFFGQSYSDNYCVADFRIARDLGISASPGDIVEHPLFLTDGFSPTNVTGVPLDRTVAFDVPIQFRTDVGRYYFALGWPLMWDRFLIVSAREWRGNYTSLLARDFSLCELAADL